MDQGQETTDGWPPYAGKRARVMRASIMTTGTRSRNRGGGGSGGSTNGITSNTTVKTTRNGLALLLNLFTIDKTAAYAYNTFYWIPDAPQLSKILQNSLIALPVKALRPQPTVLVNPNLNLATVFQERKNQQLSKEYRYISHIKSGHALEREIETETEWRHCILCYRDESNLYLSVGKWKM